MQEPENSNGVIRSDIHLPIGNHGRDEFSVGERIAIVRRLTAVVQPGREVRRVKGVQDPDAILVRDGPHDAILRPFELALGVAPG